MKEIEFRWLTRETGELDRALYPVQERVLQVRYREGPRGEDWWGKWEDIQEVEA